MIYIHTEHSQLVLLSCCTWISSLSRAIHKSSQFSSQRMMQNLGALHEHP